MKYPIIFGCSGTIITKKEKTFFEEFQPLGFILFRRNCKTKKQVIRLINDLREPVSNEVPILIDQEGGRVQRLGPPLWNSYPPAEVFGRIYKREKEKAIELIKINSQLIASELVELGMVQRERKGRSFELSVTEAFMEYFGINAENQSELKAYLEQALTS